MSTVPQTPRARATVADLRRTPEKAELIGGRIVALSPTGNWPSQLASRIFVDLFQHARAIKRGVAYTDNVGFVVPALASGRESFSPDAAYYDGPLPDDAFDFLPGPPTFAVEVRSKNDYGPAAERAIAAKRADYFEAKTLVVWDVDPVARLIRCYRRDAPDVPITFTPGQTADAEPAVPGWRLDVEGVFA